MAEPFRRLSLVERSFWQIITFRHPVYNGYSKLITALADCDKITDIPIDYGEKVNKEFGGRVYTAYRDDLDTHYVAYLKFCLRDRVLTEDEIIQINHLQVLLWISADVHVKAYKEASNDAYRKAVKQAIFDGELTDSERSYLDELAIGLGISDYLQDKIKNTEIQQMLKKNIDEALADKMLSPEEEGALVRLADGLGVPITHNMISEKQLKVSRLLWEITYGNLPEHKVAINLLRGEQCYFQKDVAWYETRKQRVAVAYSGPALRLKIVKGLYWRAGAVGLKPVSHEALVKIDDGIIFITNKRVLFMGRKKNTTIKLGRILDITKFTDGVQIEKDAGKNPVLLFNKDIDVFCAILARVIQDNN